MGALEEAAQATAIDCHRERTVAESKDPAGGADRLHHGIGSLASPTSSALVFAFQLSRERTRVVHFSKRLDNGGGINRDGARLRVRVSAIGHE